MTLKSTGLINEKADSQRTKAGILRALIPVVFFLFSAIMSAQNNDAFRGIYISESAMLYNNRIPMPEPEPESVYIAKGTIVYNDIDKAKNNEAKTKNTFPAKKIPQLIAKTG